MNARQIFLQVEPHALLKGRVGLNRCIYVPWEVFAPFERFFDKDRYQNNKYRMGGLFSNLHAAKTPDGFVNLHWDHGNPNRNVIVGGIAHGLLDLLVYAMTCWWRLGKYESNPTLATMKRILGREDRGDRKGRPVRSR